MNVLGCERVVFGQTSLKLRVISGILHKADEMSHGVVIGVGIAFERVPTGCKFSANGFGERRKSVLHRRLVIDHGRVAMAFLGMNGNPSVIAKCPSCG